MRDVDVERRLDPSRPRRQDDDAIAEPRRLADVVGDEQDGQTALPGQRLEFVVQGVPGHRVEGPERLVHQQDVGVLGESAGHRRPLAHTTGQLVRTLLAEPSEMNGLQQQLGTLAALLLADPGEAHRQLDVAPHGEPREQRRVLEHQRRPAGGGDLAGGRFVESGDEVEDRRLAAARCADETDELALAHREVDVVQGGDRVPPVAERLGHPPKVDHDNAFPGHAGRCWPLLG